MNVVLASFLKMAPLEPHLDINQPCRQTYDARRMAAEHLVRVPGSEEVGRMRAVRLRVGAKIHLRMATDELIRGGCLVLTLYTSLTTAHGLPVFFPPFFLLLLLPLLLFQQ